MILVSESTLNDRAAVPPKVTAVAPVKLLPVKTTDCPPASALVEGVMAVMTGAAWYVNALGIEAVPPGAVRATVTVPELPEGLSTVTCVSLTTVTLLPGTPPKVTPVVPVKPEPVMVTEVLPVVGPRLGNTVDITGAARYSKADKPDVAVPPPVVTDTAALPTGRAGV